MVRSAVRLLGIYLGLIGLSSCVSAPSAEHFSAFPAPLLQTSVQTFPIPIIELRGSSDQIGEQHGQKLSQAIHDLHDHYLMIFIGNSTTKFFALAAAQVFESKLRPEHLAEVKALASATRIDERQTMLGQCFLDLAQLSGCSTVALPASASPDHVARFGRNLDFWSLDIADKYTTLFIVHPDDGRYAYAAIGWPGMVGLLSGMNEHGLCLASMEVPRKPRFPAAMPYTLLYRTVLEHCRTVREAVEMLKNTTRQTANNLMLMDSAGTRAVVELSPDFVHVRWGTDNTALISTNHQRDQDTDTPGFCTRYDYLRNASEQDYGHIDEPAVQKMLAKVGNHGTLQSMVFEPANRVIYLAAGSSAAQRTFHRLDLTPYLDRHETELTSVGK